MREGIRFLLNPSSIALVGASATPGKWGYFILHNILKDGYGGKVYPVGRRGAGAFGMSFYESIEKVPDAIDLALIAVPSNSVMAELKKCALAGVRVSYVITGGFSETGEEGRRVEQEMSSLQSESGMLICGPNGQGILNTHLNLCAQMFWTMPPRGNISLITQSGNIGVSISNLSVFSGIGISQIVSTGNAACVDIPHYIEYFGDDSLTDVILVYVEGTKSGRKLIEAIREVSARKPVILMKSGNSTTGRRAAVSHSGAMASNWRVFKDLCRNAGGIVVGSFEEMWDTACIFSAQPPVRGKKVGVVTHGGGLGVVTADVLSEFGFELPPLNEKLKTQLDNILPPRWSRTNPVDLAAGEGPTTVVDVLEAMSLYGGFDVIVYVGFGESGLARYIMEGGRFGNLKDVKNVCSAMFQMEEMIQKKLIEIIRGRSLPIITIADAATLAERIKNSSITVHAKCGFVTFPTPERAVRGLVNFYRYHYGRFRDREAEDKKDN